MTDPQTAADAAERVQAVLDARPAEEDREFSHILLTVADPDRTRGRWLHLTKPDLRALLADRARTAAELEQRRNDVDDFRARRDNAVAQGDASDAEARELAQALIAAHGKNKRLLDRALAAETELEQVRGEREAETIAVRQLLGVADQIAAAAYQVRARVAGRHRDPETAATRPADATEGTGEGRRTRGAENEPQRPAEGDGEAGR